MLPQPLPDLAALDLLVTVSARGSINDAAAVHRVSQPAASMRLRTLERVLGIRLLERSTTGSKLTPAGVATVEWAGAVIEDLRALLGGVAALRAEGESHLRLAASLTVAEYLMPVWLPRFAAVAPEVGVSLEMGNTAHVAELIIDGTVELGFIEGARPPRGVRSRNVARDELVVVVGARHPWARRRQPLRPDQLAATPLLLRERGSGTREVLTEALAAYGLGVTPLAELGSTTAIKAAVAAGTAPAVLSALTVELDVRAGQLVTVPCPGLRLERTIRAVWSPHRPPSGPAAALLAVLASDAGANLRAASVGRRGAAAPR
ncbi:MAG: LysR family transcriptional regulator [Acidimicrobiales bacterium]